MSYEENVETCLKRLHSDENLEKRKRSKQSCPNFKLEFQNSLETENVGDVSYVE